MNRSSETSGQRSEGGKTIRHSPLTTHHDRSLKRRLRPWALAALVLFWGAMFVGTHTPMPDTVDFSHGTDKILHFGAYAGLAFLLGFWRVVTRTVTFRDYAAVFGITFVYSIADELLQAIPVLHRTADIWDAVADWCGSVVGLTALFLCLTFYRRYVRRPVSDAT